MNKSLTPPNLWQNDLKPEDVNKHKIKSRIKIKIRTDKSEPLIIWSSEKEIPLNKIIEINNYNSDGLLVLSLYPSYKTIKKDTTGYSKLSALEKFDFDIKTNETNEPTGYFDSTFYNYNSNKQLVSRVEKKTTRDGFINSPNTQTFEYDSKGNLIQFCMQSENQSSACRYTTYYFDKKGRITSAIDSFSLDLERPDWNSENRREDYFYNDKGLVSSIGNTHYIYDNKNRLVEKYYLSGNTKSDVEYYTYDANDNCVKILHIERTSSVFNPTTGITDQHKFDTSLYLRMYDKNSLLIESSYKYRISKPNYDLYKYEYKY